MVQLLLEKIKKLKFLSHVFTIYGLSKFHQIDYLWYIKHQQYCRCCNMVQSSTGQAGQTTSPGGTTSCWSLIHPAILSSMWQRYSNKFHIWFFIFWNVQRFSNDYEKLHSLQSVLGLSIEHNMNITFLLSLNKMRINIKWYYNIWFVLWGL